MGGMARSESQRGGKAERQKGTQCSARDMCMQRVLLSCVDLFLYSVMDVFNKEYLYWFPFPNAKRKIMHVSFVQGAAERTWAGRRFRCRVVRSPLLSGVLAYRPLRFCSRKSTFLRTGEGGGSVSKEASTWRGGRVGGDGDAPTGSYLSMLRGVDVRGRVKV